ncbi:MAG: orotidine-5'-phosphate decarboxylase [Anaerolineae bacterium]|nr:orotidine-5'-phosphate decarboxylase [Anaerolineae bacterium]
MPGFVDKLLRAIHKHHSLLCVGLDPDINRIPAGFMPGKRDIERQHDYCLSIIEQTEDQVCCYKPNIAFFEKSGAAGWQALKDVVAAIPGDIPVLLDAKRGDIGNTAKAYASAAFDHLGVDAITLNPYLGVDSVSPFLEHPGKMAFILCYTSNPSAAQIQQYGNPPLFQHLANLSQAWGDATQVGYVVGATQPDALSEVRAIVPDRWILAPGVGAQGGNLEAALASGLDAHGLGMIIPVSRSVMYAGDPRAAAQELRQNINTARQSGPANHHLNHQRLIQSLFESGCVQFGDFTLASGKKSPIYIDLRRAMSYPALFSRVILAYAQVLSTLEYDILAAVPYAALPVTGGLGQHLGVPMIYPRKEVKTYGTGKEVEGAFSPGQVAVAIEDVVTTGGSLLTALETLKKAQLGVKDVVVLVDREQDGGTRLLKAGYQLHAVLTLRQILDALKASGSIDRETVNRVLSTSQG